MYIFWICLGMGMLIQPFVQKNSNLFFVLLFGLFGEMMLIHFFAIWLPINEIFYGANFLFASFIILIRFQTIKTQLKSCFAEWESWKIPIQILGVLLTTLILMQSATKPFIVDNETYYIQTIKWLNEFGLVKGLANLHFFFGQMSGWHLLQSGFNFGFISNSLNDLNGFMMLIFTFFSLHHLNRFFQSRITMDLFLGLIPVGNLFFFQFLSAPSPDLPVFLISQLIFYLFYKNFIDYQGEFKLLLLLVIFLIFIKITVLPLLILPLVLLIRHQLFKIEWRFMMLIALMSISLYFLKNYIISGYLIYPISIFSSLLNPDWKLSPEMAKFMMQNMKVDSLTGLDFEEIQRQSFFEYFKNWLLEPGLRSVFNKLIILLLLIFPIWIRKNKTLFWLYIYALVQFGVLYFTSPQYRFFMPLITGMSLYILAKLLLNNSKFVLPIFGFFGLIALIPLLFSINVSNIKNSNFMPDKLEPYRLRNVIVPANISLHQFEYEKVREGNFEYNSPIGETEFFWITGDGELPCVNQSMLEYFKKWYHVRPQLRTGNLEDGFYAEKINK
ncbi:hypothetical protein HU137_07205 [Moheibacter sp. BDHS18]|uniref:DUF8201 domain-containing protein n=2 Tax=Moheibacter lacus TaxID=2745851 RepID=A0A838ZP58_9FLAO|nr:hypothetical protein [Moheibacter lacus]